MGCVGRQEVDMSILGGLERRERTEFVDLTFGRPPLSLPYVIPKTQRRRTLKHPKPGSLCLRYDMNVNMTMTPPKFGFTTPGRTGSPMAVFLTI